MDEQGIEPWTTPMLREYYTTQNVNVLMGGDDINA